MAWLMASRMLVVSGAEEARLEHMDQVFGLGLESH
jgi:hypothetical protein